MFKRRKDEERTELDAAWEDESQTPYFAGAAAHGEDAPLGDTPQEDTPESGKGEQANEPFPQPNSFNLVSDNVPTDAGELAATGDVPFDAEDSFAYDAESEEFTSGGARGFLDDSHTDFYEYGQEKHGVHDPFEDPDKAGYEASPAVVGRHGRHGSGKTSRQAKLAQMPEHQRRSRRMRRILLVLVIMLLALMAALGYFGWRLMQESMVVAEQEVTDVTTEVEVAAETEEVASDTGTVSAKNTNVAPLLSLLGKTQDEALELLGGGAAVALDSEVSDETSPMTHRVSVILTQEPTDSKSGAPTVYLGMGPDETVVIAGYSAATASLGYGTLSFADVVSNEHVVERTLGEAGLPIEEGSVELPNSNQYASYAEDGTTLVKEQCAFDGSVENGGKDYLWTSVLVYNYTAANATGNLADTVRQIYVYVSDKAASDEALEQKAQAAKEAKEKEEAEAKAAEEAAKKAEEEAKAAEEEKKND